MSYLSHKQLLSLVLLSIVLLFSPFTPGLRAGGGEGEAFNPGETILHHVADAHEWEFAIIGGTHLTLPLPVILYTPKGLDVFMSSAIHHGKKEEKEHEGKKTSVTEVKTALNTYHYEHGKFHLADGGHLYDFSITKNVASLFLSVILLMVIFFQVASAYKKRPGQAPRGMQSFFEPIIVFVRDDIAKGAIGPKHERFLPYLLTIFFFIWFNNVLGLFPAGANLTGNIAITLTLALFTFFITLFSGNRNYWSHIFNTPGVPWWLKTVVPIMPIVEFMGIFTKPFSLMIRLFANITAGHIIMLSLFSLIFMFKSIGLAVAPVSVAFAVAMNFLELFVALLQAYVFTLLSALYFGQAVEEHHHEHEEAHH
ncbi:MAG: F0F1 ATP synthase subunit A [Microscillaceae bacterium]